MLSVSTGPSSSQADTVRRGRHLALDAIHGVMSDSPNPLRVPPPSLLGPAQDNSAVSDVTLSIGSTNESSVELLDIPMVAFAELQYLTFAGNDQSRNGNPCSVWVIVEILRSLSQGAVKEPFAQKLSTNKSFNHPGLLKSVVLTLSPLQNCHIVAILGQSTAATLSANETITAIVLVTLDKSLFPSTRPSPRKQNGRPEASSSRRRPTSDLLNDELLDQLLGKFKRTSQAKEQKVEEPILWAKVAYNHSLFPPWYPISHEETLTVTRATICNTQNGLSQKQRQQQQRGSPERPGAKTLNTEQTESAGESIMRVLRDGLCFDGHAVGAASHPIVNASQAVKLLNDFLKAATSLPPDMNRTLQMLKVRYSMLIKNDDEPFAAQPKSSPKQCNLFDRRKDERRKSSEPESPKRNPPNAGFDSARRNAFEIDRENIEQGLTDVTNRTRYRSCDLISGGTRLLGYDGTTDLAKDNAIPPPLFSPKRGPTLVQSSATDFGSTYGSTRTPKKTGCHGGRQHLPTNIGSASFYAAEVEDMVRQAFGGATTTCHHRSESLKPSIQMVDGHGGTTEEDATDKARQIWGRMRISIEGSGTSTKSNGVRYSDESADEAEMARECKAIGAPWLA